MDKVKLSPREKEIISFLAMGFLFKEIAEMLYISERTVQTHCTRIKLKFKAKNTPEAVAKYIMQNNIINIEFNPDDSIHIDVSKYFKTMKGE